MAKTFMSKFFFTGKQKVLWSKIFSLVVNGAVVFVFAVVTALAVSFLRGTSNTSFPSTQSAPEDRYDPIPGPKTWCRNFDHKLDGWKHINFIETSGEKCLKIRQACTIESAARANPLLPIQVHISSKAAPGKPEVDVGAGLVRDCEVMKILEHFKNIQVRVEDLSKYFEDTPLWELYTSGKFDRSEYSYQHLSDAVRIAILYKNGGFYLDTDLIVLRPMHCLLNAAGFVEFGAFTIENDVLVFEKGHPFLWYYMEEMVKIYKPNERSSIGPLGVTSRFMQFCNYQPGQNYLTRLYKCSNQSSIALFGPEAFHPIGYGEREKFFMPNFNKTELNIFETSFSTHIYGSGHGAEAPESSIFAYLAKNYCPNVYSYSMNRWGEF